MNHPAIVPVSGLPDPTGHSYNHAVRAGDFVYIAGQCGVGDDGKIVSTEFRPQAERVLERVEIALRAAGGDRHSIVAMTVSITDIRYGKEFVGIRGEFFDGRDFPTSALIGTPVLMPPGALVEVQATAYIPQG